MKNNSIESRYHHEDEVNLINILKSIIERKWLVLGLTGFFTLLAYIYTLSFTPYYVKTIDLTSPDESTVVVLNKLKLMDEDRKTIYSRFLTKLTSTEFQKKVFFENDYLTKLNPNNKIIDDIDDFSHSFISSIKLVEAQKRFVSDTLHRLSIQGDNGETISQFLNDLTHEANISTIDDLYNLLYLKISLRLSEISLERQSLLSKAVKERLNEIEVLKAAAQMAKSLGIKENNFKQINAQGNTFNLSIAFSDSDDSAMPKWYLYGETALLERISWLKERSDDAPFIPELVEIEIQKMELESLLEEDSTEIRAMEIAQNFPANKIVPEKRFIVIIGFIIGLIGSIFLVLILNALKPHDESIA